MGQVLGLGKRCAPTRQTSIHSSVDTPLAYPPGGRIPQRAMRHAPFQRHRSTPSSQPWSHPGRLPFSIGLLHPLLWSMALLASFAGYSGPRPLFFLFLGALVLKNTLRRPALLSSFLAGFLHWLLQSTALLASFTSYSSPQPVEPPSPVTLVHGPSGLLHRLLWSQAHLLLHLFFLSPCNSTWTVTYTVNQ